VANERAGEFSCGVNNRIRGDTMETGESSVFFIHVFHISVVVSWPEPCLQTAASALLESFDTFSPFSARVDLLVMLVEALHSINSVSCLLRTFDREKGSFISRINSAKHS